tara:strand:- start:349 stop:474 length:126 start_codon:yes stop_codon:yes gene_type:complete
MANEKRSFKPGIGFQRTVKIDPSFLSLISLNLLQAKLKAVG